MDSIPEKDIARFWSKVKIGSPDECWKWQGINNGKNRYGIFRFVGTENGSTKKYAHRISWTLANGEISDGLFVLHKCDNPPCVNPKHLYLGTQTDNMQDASKKGRVKIPGLHGEDIGLSKLKESDIPDIRRMIANGIYYSEIGKIYGVSKVTIFHIKIGRTWSWIK